MRKVLSKIVACEKEWMFVRKFTDHILYSLERFAIKLLLFFKLPFAFHFLFNYLPISS